MNRTRKFLLVATAVTAAFLLGCVREATNEELMRVAIQAQIITVSTTVFYTGSDEAFDYFYLDKPLERDDACRVPRTTTHVLKRMPTTRDRSKWQIYPPQKTTIFTNGNIVAPGFSVLMLGPQQKP